ncbi:hybrid sensor histidine kinase/response regulator [Dokdonella soli]|uniref:hybrid sensor histidine kinase/response regulator n=1 Tax=Dokdonella soli TaxID=529810 RepID=UPI0031E08F8A
MSGLRAVETASAPQEVGPLLPKIASLRAASAGSPGVIELLRVWNATLQQRASDAPYFGASEVASAIAWFSRLRSYLDGTLPHAERAVLAQLPADVAGMPQLKPVWVAEIARRLSSSAPIASVPHAAPAEPPALAAMALPQTDQDDTAFLLSPTSIEPAEHVASAFVVEQTQVHIEAFTDAQADAATALALNDSFPALPFATSESSPVADSLGLVGFPDHDNEPSTSETSVDEQRSELIWISDEERELTKKAVVEELMPLAQQWVDDASDEARANTTEAVGYQSELIANVLDVIGTQQLARSLRAIRETILEPSSAVDSERVLQWCTGLLIALDQPGEDSAMLLASLVDGVPALDDEWRSALSAELARVRIGRDPAHAVARKREALEEDVSLQPATDALPAVLEGMLRELPGNATRLGASVRGAVLEQDANRLSEARRVAHTLKGDANTVGVRGLASITHALEDILDAYARQQDAPDPRTAELLVDGTDKIEEISDFLLGRGPHPDGLLDLYQRLLDASNALMEDGGVQPSVVEKANAPQELGHVAAPVAKSDPGPAPKPATASPTVRNLTLGSDVLDHLQNLAGEATIVSQGIDRLLEGIVALRRDQEASSRHSQELLARLDDLVALRGAALQSTAIASGTDLDPLEIDQYNELHVISRQLAEAQTDASVSVRGLRRTLSALADLRSEQERINTDLQRSILRTRMVPFNQVSPRLQRIARQTAKQVLKQVDLKISGADTLIDAELLERIVEPIGHLIRNAIDHGLETPEQRVRLGKPETAPLHIDVGVQGDTATIDIRDDGRGLDFEAIRARAVNAGLLPEGAQADERQLTRFVLLPGFSTRDTTTEISGRGVGLDVVNQRVMELRGTLQLQSRPGQGLAVRINVPVTQTLANVILVSGQRHRTAVVASSVEQIVGFAADACLYDETSTSLNITIEGKNVPALPIESVYRESADVNMWLSAGGLGLLMRNAAGDPTLVLVRSVDEVRSIVVKPVSALLPPIPAVRGITQLPDGGLAPVVDLNQLLAHSTDRRETERALQFVPAPEIPRIVVADDSLSARRSLEQLMRDAGYVVDVASDGFETISQVESKPTAVLLLDMEMPRMNGLEVARNLRNKPASRDLPILMITSRTAEKHRLMAEEAGVTRMLAKPVSEDMLVTLVADLIASRASVTADE